MTHKYSNFVQIEKILEEGSKGGQVIDLLNTGMMTGNAVLREMYKKLIKFCYKVLFHQVKLILQKPKELIHILR